VDEKNLSKHNTQTNQSTPPCKAPIIGQPTTQQKANSCPITELR